MRKTNRAFSLIELLVATVVLTILVYTVGRLLSNTKGTVSQVQGRLRANAAASGINHILRQDFYMLSKLGFLRIEENCLSFTVVGDIRSIVGNARGNGGIVSYGLCKNVGKDQFGDPIPSDIFFRRMMVLDNNSDTAGADKHPSQLDFADIQLAKNVFQYIPFFDDFDNLELKVPVENTADVGKLWMVLAAFSKAPMTGTMFSYLLYDPETKTSTWGSEARTWTKDNTNWPKAIRIRFQSDDPALPQEVRSSGYEIIVPVGAGL
ncbi:MAG: prepilin-type N-terminal cleavage/methylation domain-containing protein [Phycisphaerales bacterium]|nr:prepilin-type N-terminal cleavage/methylation domain-containing protein [Phycisphaerales bacterium]